LRQRDGGEWHTDTNSVAHRDRDTHRVNDGDAIAHEQRHRDANARSDRHAHEFAHGASNRHVATHPDTSPDERPPAHGHANHSPNPNLNLDARARGDALTHGYPPTVSDAFANCCRVANRDAHLNGHAHVNSHAESDSDPHADGNQKHPVAHSNATADQHRRYLNSAR
jgi:hypothetical protein